MRGTKEGLRARLAFGCVAAVCLSTAMLVRTWSVPYLIALIVATGAACALGWALRPRWPWRVLLALCLTTMTVASSGWRAMQPGVVAVPAGVDSTLRTRVAQVAADVFPELMRSAQAMARLPLPDRFGARLPLLEPWLPSATLGEAAGVVLVRGRPEAWAGLVRLPLEALRDSIGVASNTFYTVAYARASSPGGGRSAVAMRTLQALPPADRLSRAFLDVTARRLGLARIDIASGGDSVIAMKDGDVPRLWLAPVPRHPASVRLQQEERARLVALVLLGVTGLLWFLVCMRSARDVFTRLSTLAALGLTVALAPLSTLSNLVPVLNPTWYFSPVGGPLTASVGVMGLAGALWALAVLVVVRHRRWQPSVWLAMPVPVMAIGLGPIMLRELSRGISLPERGAPPQLWVAWEGALFLVGAAVLLLCLRAASVMRRNRPYASPAAASAAAGVAALLAPLVWPGDNQFPAWYVALWGGAVLLTVLARRTRTQVLHATFVAACGATVLTWSAITRQRIELAERDVTQLTVPDLEVQPLVERLLRKARSGPAPVTAADLLRLYVGTELAASGSPAELAVWSNGGATDAPDAEIVLAQLARREGGERALVRYADSTGQDVLQDFGSTQGVQLVLAAPLDSGRVLSAVVAPRSQLIAEDPFAALLGLEVPNVVEPPYRMTVYPTTVTAPTRRARWQQRDDGLHSDWQLASTLGGLTVHVEVELRSLDVLFTRGALLVLFDLAVFALLWLLVAVSDDGIRRWVRGRLGGWRSSYRARLTGALLGAFALPSAAFAFWTWNRSADEDLTSRSLLVQETLRAVRLRELGALAEESSRLETPLFLYRDGVLEATADPLHAAVAPLGHLLDPVAADEVVFGLEETASRRLSVGAEPTLFGYRVMERGAVIAAPARRTELTLERQQRDVLALLLVAMALGAGIAWGLSGLAARAFSRPIGALRRAAEEVAGGARVLPSLGAAPPSEFRPVYDRFRQMAVELSDSRQDLARAQRIFAWGEMARQVAHEVKNPLTPIRLGVQHIRRAFRDGRGDFPDILDRNVDRVLAEIDRLDDIARSFSQYGTRPEEAERVAMVALTPLLHDVVALERMGDSAVQWEVDADDDLWVLARDGELREVLLNVLENARLANARRVAIEATHADGQATLVIDDDGDGVSESALPHLFEPHFSTRTSGSGLGLAISRRLVESWGGRIQLSRRTDRGTRVTITLPRVTAP